MKQSNKIIIILAFIIAMSAVYAWTPPDDIVGMNYYSILNFSNINATKFYMNGKLVLNNESNLNVNYSTFSNSTTWWSNISSTEDIVRVGNIISGAWAASLIGDNYLGNLSASKLIGISSLNYKILSYWDNITGRPTYLSNFTDDISSDLNVNSSVWWDGESSQSNLNVNSSTYWDSETSQADLNVNSSTWWANLTSWSSDMFESIANVLRIDMGWFNSSVNDKINSEQSRLNVNSSNYWDGLDTQVNITKVGNLVNLKVIGNVSTEDYYYGQPIAGGVDTGIIFSKHIDSNGNINLTRGEGLNLSYPNIIVRTVNTDTLKETYCNISEGTVVVPDEAHTAYYVTPDCVISNTPVENFVSDAINVVGNVPIFHVMAHSSEIQMFQGLPVLNRMYIRSRVLHFKTQNLDVISGLDVTEGNGLNFTIGSGEYILVDSTVSSTEQNLSTGAKLEVFYRDGGNWMYDVYVNETQTGLNLSSCEDASENLVACTNTGKYRRYFIYLTGYQDGIDDTTIHQALASNEIYYNTIAACLDLDSSPIVLEIPDIFTYTAVPLYAYCGKASDTTFSGSFIDLRETQKTVAGADIDTSIFLTRDGSRTLTNHWDAGNYNITALAFNGYLNGTASSSIYWDNETSQSDLNVNSSVYWANISSTEEITKVGTLDSLTVTNNVSASWFKGFINWSNIQNKFIEAVGSFFFMEGTTLRMNTTVLNATIDDRVTLSGNYTAGLGIKLEVTNFSVEAGNGLEQELSGLKVADAGINNSLLRWKTGQNLTTSDSPTFNDLTVSNEIQPNGNLSLGKGIILDQEQRTCFDTNCNHYIFENSSGVLIIV